VLSLEFYRKHNTHRTQPSLNRNIISNSAGTILSRPRRNIAPSILLYYNRVSFALVCVSFYSIRDCIVAHRSVKEASDLSADGARSWSVQGAVHPQGGGQPPGRGEHGRTQPPRRPVGGQSLQRRPHQGHRRRKWSRRTTLPIQR
jgi:hypothetical protein